MNKTILRFLPILGVLLFSTYCFSAESTKFKHVVSLYADAKGGSLKYPEGIACNAKSLVIVADTGNNRLLSYTYEEDRLKGGTEIKVPQLAAPLHVQLDSKGDIYALDGKQRRIVHLKPNGAFSAYIEPLGLPAPTNIVPKSFKIDSADNMFILDILSERVVVLDSTGKFLNQLSFPKDAGFISDLAVDDKGTVFLLDSVNNLVFAATKEVPVFSILARDIQEHTESATAITVDKRGFIYLVDKDGGYVVLLGQDGSFRQRLFSIGVKNGLLNYPTQICINASGSLMIADRGNSRVQLFELVK